MLQLLEYILIIFHLSHCCFPEVVCLSCLKSHNLSNGYNNRWKKSAVLCFNL